ncbi:metalloregulator ArsR/SmtB family transcription factor [Demequina sp. NBRC 110056]|uniref:helix-turn-helix transcriptional regulator n=1 Tax=Demequina sp. NBRC 110056 TaxID=1570345 RepID=UPI001F3FB20A|nr:helix-turn-helix domain-containing protein [Demequina sp. NBRC 110056]
MGTDTTRDRVLGLIASAGPITAATLAAELGVTPAGVRRHLSALADDALITEHEQPGTHVRGRGRPAKSYVATTEGQRSLTTAYSSVAVDAVSFMREHGNLSEFVDGKLAELEETLRAAVPADATMEERVEALSRSLAEQGYATSVRPGPGGFTVQLCQGHCPVQSIAEEAPEWCEAETRAFSRVLDVHVQRLSTLAGGAHVCTTTIPVTAVTAKEG